MLSKLEQYSRGVEHCDGKAAGSPNLEIRQLWASLAQSYEFLRAREQRLSEEDCERDAKSMAARLDG